LGGTNWSDYQIDLQTPCRKRDEVSEMQQANVERTPGEDAWLDELAWCHNSRDKLRTILRAYRANLLSQSVAMPAQEALCGTAGSADTSTNTAILPTVKNASPSGEALLPQNEWANLSLESQHKLQTWYRLATERLQAILDSDEFDGDSE
jgi:hypothetical protein